MNEILAINAALSLAEALIPKIAELVAKGEVSANEQAALLNRYQALRDKIAEHFTGPEWEVEK